MTKDEIYKLAREAELGFLLGDNWMLHHELERFANLVAAKEREACAKVCDELSDKHTWEGCYANECAGAIRARGKQV